MCLVRTSFWAYRVATFPGRAARSTVMDGGGSSTDWLLSGGSATVMVTSPLQSPLEARTITLYSSPPSRPVMV